MMREDLLDLIDGCHREPLFRAMRVRGGVSLSNLEQSLAYGKLLNFIWRNGLPEDMDPTQKRARGWCFACLLRFMYDVVRDRNPKYREKKQVYGEYVSVQTFTEDAQFDDEGRPLDPAIQYGLIQKHEPEYDYEFDIHGPLKHALESLTEYQLACVQAHVLADMRFCDIERMLGKRSGSASSTYRYAINKMRSKLELPLTCRP